MKRYIALEGSNKEVVTEYKTYYHSDSNFKGILLYGFFFKHVNCSNNAKPVFGKTHFTCSQNNTMQVFEQSNDRVLSKNIWPLQKSE